MWGWGSLEGQQLGSLEPASQVQTLTLLLPWRGTSISFLEPPSAGLFKMPSSGPRWSSGEEPTCQFRSCRSRGFYPWVRKIPSRRKWQPTAVFSPGKSHRQKEPTVQGMEKELGRTKHTHTTRDFLGRPVVKTVLSAQGEWV